MSKVPRVNKYECCGCSLCVYALPEVFRLTPDGYSEVYATDEALEKDIEKVIKNCPVGCVHWFIKGS
ncbi:MAG: ferredoxin [Asgard group archaeon]|nr:ferredoxin [Asgard group archaeon]